LTDDMEELVRRGLVDAGWRDRPYQGIACRSLVAFAVRKGNPKAIHDWRDLVRADVRIVSPDPEFSGCGMWNLCALYGAALRGHAGVEAGDPVLARSFVAQVWSNVVATGKSAHEAYKTFQAGVGDVAIIYESEITKARMFGHAEERVIPASTLLVESPIAVVDRNVDKHGDTRSGRGPAVGPLDAEDPGEARILRPAPGRPRRVRRAQGVVPAARGPLDDRRSRRLGPGDARDRGAGWIPRRGATRQVADPSRRGRSARHPCGVAWPMCPARVRCRSSCRAPRVNPR
jgi:hypothetical protein